MGSLDVIELKLCDQKPWSAWRRKALDVCIGYPPSETSCQLTLLTKTALCKYCHYWTAGCNVCEYPKEENVGSFFPQRLKHNRHSQSQDWELEVPKSCGLSFLRLKKTETKTQTQTKTGSDIFLEQIAWTSFCASSTLCTCYCCSIHHFIL